MHVATPRAGRRSIPSLGPLAEVIAVVLAAVATMGAGYLTRMMLPLDQNRPPSQDPVAHVSSGDYVPVTIVTKEVKVPVMIDCNEDRGCCSDCNAKPRARLDWLSVLAALAFVLRPRRRR